VESVKRSQLRRLLPRPPAAANTERKRLERNQDNDHQIETGNSTLNDGELDYFDLDSFNIGQTADDGLGSEFFDDINVEQTGIEIEQWLSSLEFSLQKSHIASFPGFWRPRSIFCHGASHYSSNPSSDTLLLYVHPSSCHPLRVLKNTHRCPPASSRSPEDVLMICL